jgi:hypothetical protein
MTRDIAPEIVRAEQVAAAGWQRHAVLVEALGVLLDRFVQDVPVRERRRGQCEQAQQDQEGGTDPKEPVLQNCGDGLPPSRGRDVNVRMVRDCVSHSLLL